MRPRRGRRLSLPLSLAIWCALACVVWLDAHAPAGVQRATLVAWIVTAVEAIWSGAQVVFDGIEVAIGAAVSWLGTAVGWLATKIGDIVVSSGSIFSKTWDALKGLWSDVIKPAIDEIVSLGKRFYDWLQKFIAPVLKWANAVRDEITCLYKRFVAPILNALKTAQSILDILAKLHVPFAAALEQYTSDLENWISSEYLKLFGWVNKVIDTLNGLLTLDGLLQRLVLLRSIERDWFYVQRALLNPMNQPLSDKDAALSDARWKPQTGPDLQAALADYMGGGSNDTGQAIDAAVQNAVDHFNSLPDSQAA